MRRIDLFEFEDQKWLPEIIRNCITDLLDFSARKLDFYKPVFPIIKKGLEKSEKKVIIDFCSGSGGGILKINDRLKKNYEQNFKIILTDLYPNKTTLKHITSKTDNIDYKDYPVNAINIPKELTEIKAFRTLFASFHHFQPKEAKKILENAVIKNTPIGIFEITERTLSEILIVIIMSIFVSIFFTLFIRPFRLSRIILTYLIPIIPICYTWDGIASVLRSYSKEELKTIIKEINSIKYAWEIGRKNLNPIAIVVYVFGYPNKE